MLPDSIRRNSGLWHKFGTHKFGTYNFPLKNPDETRYWNINSADKIRAVKKSQRHKSGHCVPRKTSRATTKTGTSRGNRDEWQHYHCHWDSKLLNNNGGPTRSRPAAHLLPVVFEGHPTLKVPGISHVLQLAEQITTGQHIHHYMCRRSFARNARGPTSAARSRLMRTACPPPHRHPRAYLTAQSNRRQRPLYISFFFRPGFQAKGFFHIYRLYLSLSNSKCRYQRISKDADGAFCVRYVVQYM